AVDVIELRDRQRRREPGAAPVRGYVHAAVVRGDHSSRIFGVDPDVVMVAVMDAADGLKRLPPVDALEHWNVRAPQHVGVPGIDGNRRVIPGPLAKDALIVGAFPGAAAVVRTEQPALLRLDQRVDAPALRRRDRDADLPPRPVWQSAVAG